MSTLLPATEIETRLKKLNHWQRDEDVISRQFKFSDFVGAMRFVNAVADLAEEANHHPDIDIRWNKVLLRLTNHSAGGLTEADFDLAGKIDGVA